MPFPNPVTFSACKSSFRRPARDQAPTDAKACCLYPNIARALSEAYARGFDNAILLDPNGNVAEFSNANLWIVKDGRVRTPSINGTFLNGITRQRVMSLLRDNGHDVEEVTLQFKDVYEADEIFNSGNMGKVMPCNRIEDRLLEAGPVYQHARQLYFEFAETQAA
jgi:branched-chain amino acid aminotransferase